MYRAEGVVVVFRRTHFQQEGEFLQGLQLFRPAVRQYMLKDRTVKDRVVKVISQ